MVSWGQIVVLVLLGLVLFGGLPKERRGFLNHWTAASQKKKASDKSGKNLDT